MARIQLVLPDEDRDRFVHEARREGVSLSEWIRLAARERVETRLARQRFQDTQDVTKFFERCDGLDGPEREPDWVEHLSTMQESRAQGTPEA